MLDKIKSISDSVKKIISEAYKVKIQQFRAHYGIIKTDILPHDFLIGSDERVLGGKNKFVSSVF